MYVQILGLREYVCPKTGKKKLAEKFFEKGWKTKSVQSLFANLDKVDEMIPDAEKYNLFYTVSKCLPEKGRILAEQSVIPFDLDELGVKPDDKTLDKIIDTVTAALKVSRYQIGIVWSGHGLQMLIQTSTCITSTEDFDKYRDLYKAVVGDLNSALWTEGLPGSFDPSVWSPARLMRLPGTMNDKRYKDKALVPVECYVINADMVEVDFSLENAASLPDVPKSESLAKYREPDTEGVEECEFLKWCLDEPNAVSEPQWYGMLSIVGRLENGVEKAHEYSQGHKDYSEYDTDRKLAQALKASGPRTCKNIGNLWDGCIRCKHYDNVTSPITIQGPNYIKTKDTGFYNIKINKDTGEIKRVNPNFRDLMKFFSKEKPGIYTTTKGADSMYYDREKKYWVDIDDEDMEVFAQTHFQPDGGDVVANTVSEAFRKHIRKEATMKRFMGWSTEASAGKMNLQNGVLDLKTLELKPHAMKYGFTSLLPYNYSKEATCPRFDSFMEEVTLGDKQMQKGLLEYVAYSMSGMGCEMGKALILVGDGANGKSTFTDIIKEVMGKASYTNVGLGDLAKEGHIISLKGKLASFGDEVPANAFNRGKSGVGEVFKSAITGGEITGRELYKRPVTFKNNAKFFLSCNELPHINDHSNGIFRRMLIIPFNAVFSELQQDKKLGEKLKVEAAGILNRIIAAYNDLEKRGGFDTIQASTDALESYREEEDTVRSWFKEHCTVTNSHENRVPIVDLFQNFQSYCEAENAKYDKEMRKAAFVKRLKKLHNHHDTYLVSGNKVRGFSNIELKDYTSF